MSLSSSRTTRVPAETEGSGAGGRCKTGMIRTARPRPARAAAALVAAVLVLGAAPPVAAASATPQERRLLTLVNRARENRGIPALRMGPRMRTRAHRHSLRMANRTRLFHHRCLSCVLPKPYQAIGENVAVGGGLGPIHRALMRSRPHRRNILCRCYRKAGMGVVRRDGRLWVTQRFWG